MHLPSVVSRDGLGGARPECPASLAESSRPRPIAQNRGSQDSGYDSHDRRRLRIRNGLFPSSSPTFTKRAGFPYDYVSSRETLHWQHKFHGACARPKRANLVVWRGPCRHRHRSQRTLLLQFRAFRSDTQFYDSPYWRSRWYRSFLSAM